MEPSDLRICADELYAAPASEFVATRTALARRAREGGHKDLAAAVGKLAKPSVSAALVNGLVREHPDLVGELADLGDAMRTAQANLEAASLAQLRPRRDELFARMLDAAAQAARAGGRAASAATLDEVRATLVASLADAAAQDAVASGHLTRAIAYAGFGEVDLAEAVAIEPVEAVERGAADADPDEGCRGEDRGPLRRRGIRAVGDDETAPVPDEADSEALDAAARRNADRDAADRRRIDAAQQALTDADRGSSQAQLAVAEAERDADRQRTRVDELAALLDRARAEADEAQSRLDEARAAAQAAQAEVDSARRALEALEALGR
ncbi:hypothetical protein [Agilicoccus flavus]|uniref:hypothetical protein n=1 Tax=Agilicoccus flavus TaxID=2775968 RepID=UPI001CF7082A|nr:hypothetical protein [Agilicoccus flavus]